MYVILTQSEKQKDNEKTLRSSPKCFENVSRIISPSCYIVSCTEKQKFGTRVDRISIS